MGVGQASSIWMENRGSMGNKENIEVAIEGLRGQKPRLQRLTDSIVAYKPTIAQ